MKTDKTPASGAMRDIAREFDAPAIDELVRRAEQLTEMLQSRTLEFVLCHADIHGGEVPLTDDEELFLVELGRRLVSPEANDPCVFWRGGRRNWNMSRQV